MAAFASGGVAQTCPEFEHPMLKAGPPIDLGDGLVVQFQERRGHVVGSEASFAESIYLFHDCAAGPSLWLQSFREEPEGSVTYEKREETAAVIAENTQYTLAALSTAARVEGIEVREIGAVGVETCLCAAVYPALKGNKVPYEDVR